MYEVFILPNPHGNLSAEYKANYKYIGVIYDETKAVAITDLQYRACQHANGQFCRKNAFFQPSQTQHHALPPYMLKVTRQQRNSVT